MFLKFIHKFLTFSIRNQPSMKGVQIEISQKSLTAVVVICSI